MQKFTLLLVIFLLSYLSVAGQSKQPVDLTILSFDTSTTVEQITELYGPAKTDKITKLDASELSKQLNSIYSQPIFRHLKYESKKFFNDFFSVNFFFKDNTLIMIDIELKTRVLVSDLPRLVNANFDQVSRYGIVSAHYPDNYIMTATTETYFILGSCRSERMGTEAGTVTRIRKISKLLAK